MAEHAERRITFREMSAPDLDDVMLTETRGYAFPWTRGIFEDCLRSGYECRVLLLDGRVAGHGVISAAAGEAHLLNVCVRREHRGQGLGRLFVRYLLGRASVLGATTLFLEVRPSNRSAVALYRSIGFDEVGLRKDYYPSSTGREDALVFAMPLPMDA